MILQYLKFSISITIISWMVGMIINAILNNKEFYKNLSNLNFIKSKILNKNIGLGIFKWVVKNTFFKFFNQSLKLRKKIEMSDLYELRKQMTTAEMNHLIGFVFVTLFALVKIIKGYYLFGLIFMIVNAILNLYPSLLQQENKRRIDKLIKKYSQ